MSPTMHLLSPAFIGCCLVVFLGVAAKPVDVEYAVVIDAGSTGSRVRIYAWHERTFSERTLPRFNMTSNYKMKPGISSYAKHLVELAEHINGLVSHAKENVPATRISKTPIYLMATAGMRLLLEAEADAVMNKIHALLSDKSVNPFKYKRIQSRILSGEEEGVFGWLAVNYLNNLFPVEGGPFSEETRSSSNKQKVARSDSWGIVELGGASLQIAFVPSGSLLAHKFPVKVLGTYFPVYVHSYLGFGQQQILKKIVNYLLANNEGSTSIDNPCMLKGDTKSETRGATSVVFQGTGNPTKCRDIFTAILGVAECSPMPCGLGSVYQPTIPENKMFFELAAFAHTIKAIGILDSESPTHTLADIDAATARYCNKTIEVVKQETGRNGDFLSIDCTIGVYMEVLFKDIYRFKETAKFSSGFNINGGEPEWALGAVIYEHERRVPTCDDVIKIRASQSGVDSASLTPIVLALTFLLVVLNTRHCH